MPEPPATSNPVNEPITHEALSRALRSVNWQIWGICGAFLLLILLIVIAALLLIPANAIQQIQNASVPQGAGEADFIKVFIPLLVVGLGFVLGMLGLKRLEGFDKEIASLRNSVSTSILEERKLLNEELNTARNQIDMRFNEVKQDVQALVERYATALLAERQGALENRLEKGEVWADSLIARVQKELQPYEWLAEKQDQFQHFTGILTIGIAHTRVSALYAEEKVDAALQIAQHAIKNELPGTKDDFHNLGSELAKRDQQKLAMQVVELGLKYYPKDVDLLSDGIKWNSDIGRLTRAEELYKALCDIDTSLWNWRCFVFVGDFLELTHRPEAAIKLYEEFRTQLPDEERGYSGPGIYYMTLGKYDAAIEILEQGMIACRKCPQVAFSLSRSYYEKGLYEKAIKAADRALESNADEQPTVNQPAILWKRALAQDAWLHKKISESTGNEVDSSLLELARCAVIDYRTALSMIDASGFYRIRGPQRIRIMEALLLRYGVPHEIVEEFIGAEATSCGEDLSPLKQMLLQKAIEAKISEHEAQDS